MLREAGIDPDRCYYTNVINKQPPNNNMTKFFIPVKTANSRKVPSVRGLYPDLPVLEGLDLLRELIEKLQPKIIIGLGNYSLWGLTYDNFGVGNGTRSAGTLGHKIPTGIVQWRGSQLRSTFGDIPFMPTYHPAAILRQWDWRPQLVHDLRARVKRYLDGAIEWDEPPRNYIFRPSFDQVMNTLTDLTMRATLSESPLLLSADIETLQPHLECIGLAWSRSDAICIPVMSRDNWEGYWSPIEEQEIFLALKTLLEHSNVEVVGQNFFYDYQYLFYYWAIKPNYKHDTMLAHHTIYPGTKMGLDYLSSMYCTWHRYWKDDGKEASKQHDDNQRWIYNCRDVVTTYEVIEELWKVIRYYRLERQYAIQMVRAQSAVGMMLQGVKIDERRRGQERIRHMEAAQEYQNWFMNVMPASVWQQDRKKANWFDSRHQLKDIFFDVLGQQDITNRKTGNLTIDKDALKKISNREPLLRPFIKKMLEYNELDTYGQFINMRIGNDRRMRGSFSPTTETFRYRSSADVFGYGRNLQNLPTGNEDGD